jgi:hypothetical protein
MEAEPRGRAGLNRETTDGVVEQPDHCPPKQVNGCPQFTMNECKEHSKSRLDTVTTRVHLSNSEKLKFLIDTGAEISIVKGASLRSEIDYEPTRGINVRGISNTLLKTEGTVVLKLFTTTHETTHISYHGRQFRLPI